MIVAQTLQKAFPEKRIFTSSKNFNGEFGLPLSVFQIDNLTPGLI
jgi:UDP-N-acetylmuramyl pentapeptide synthase